MPKLPNITRVLIPTMACIAGHTPIMSFKDLGWSNSYAWWQWWLRAQDRETNLKEALAKWRDMAP